LLVAVVVVVAVWERWRLLGWGSSGSGDPVSDYGGDARGGDVSSLTDSCVAFELSKG
jgi:hypothetical protein